MSSLGGRLRELVAYESKDHTGSKFCLISIWKLQRLAPCGKCFIHVQFKVSFGKKIWYFPLRNVPLLFVQPSNALMLQHLIIQFSLYYLSTVSSGRLREVKTTENFKLLALKVVAVAYERWSLTRGSKYSDLTWNLENWSLRRGGRLREVVATGG